jgi:hypothetical protein
VASAFFPTALSSCRHAHVDTSSTAPDERVWICLSLYLFTFAAYELFPFLSSSTFV